MSEKSSPGATPCVYRFNATLTRSTLPVRSPLPNRQPSRRSAPAISANSPAAVPVPRSLWGCTDRRSTSRRARWRCIHSIMSAKMFGVLCSTVDGRLTMHLCCGVGCQTSVTASTTRLAKASSVPENISGEYSKLQSVPGCCRGQIAQQARVGHCQIDHTVLVQSEHHAPHHRRGGVVEVHDGARRTDQRFEGTTDQFLARLRQHLDAHVVGDQFLFDEQAHEIEVGLRGRGETHLDLLEADAHQHLEQAQLACRVHRFDQRLIAVAKVDAAPERRARQHGVGPASVGQADRREGTVFGRGLSEHGHGRTSWVGMTRNVEMQTARCVS